MGTTFGLVAVAKPSTQASGRDLPTALVSASDQAQSTQDPVLVDSETTETSTVTAEPDGTFTLTSDLTPVRVQDDDGQWQSIDTDLHADSNGRLAPAATTQDVTFSGGGAGPLVDLHDGAGSFSLSLPYALPAPVIDGATATYASVLPGVDVQVSAAADSFSEVLIVHDAAAAANPDLAKLRFGVQADGLRVASDGHGGLTATDDSGIEQLHGSEPMMWDSTPATASSDTPDATDPGAAAVTPLPASLPTVDGTDSPATTTLTLTPPANELKGSDVTYPVYIDPNMNGARTHFAVVTTNNNWHYYDDTSNDLKVGYCDWSECNGTWKARTYLSFNTDALGDAATTAKVYHASVEAYEIHNAHGCVDEPVDLYSAGAISSSTTWDNQNLGSKLDSDSEDAGNTCSSDPGGDVTFNDSAVVSQFQAAANNDTNTLTFALKAPDETERNQWKRFASAKSGTSAAQITVNYNFPPSKPYALGVSGSVACANKPVYSHDPTPTLTAKAKDNNSPHIPTHHHFELYIDYGSEVRNNPAGVAANSDSSGVGTASWTTSSSNSNNQAALTDRNYSFRDYASAYSDDSTDAAGPYSDWFQYTQDTTSPAQPSISSFDYPQDTWGTETGAGNFALSGSSDTAGFAYSFDSSGDEPLPIDTTCSYNSVSNTASSGRVLASGGTASLPMPTLSPGPHTLWIKAFDDAHNVSTQSVGYSFYASPNLTTGASFRHEGENFQPSAVTTASSVCATSNCATYKEPANSRWANSSATHLATDKTDPDHAAQWATTFTTPIEADYAVNIQLTTCNHCGILKFAIDNQPLTQSALDPSTHLPITQVDTYSVSTGVENVALGGIHLINGNHTITYSIVGANPDSQNYTYAGSYGSSPAVTLNFSDHGQSAAIDYFRVQPINNATYASLNAAMNNDGIIADSATTAGDISPGANQRTLSQNTLTAAGAGPGAHYTVDSASFTMPSSNSNGTDNVIAMGQKIQFAGAANASNLDLLVASTCGGTVRDDSIQVTLNFSDNTYASTTLPAIPDWLTGTLGKPNVYDDATITVAARLAYSHIGTARDNSATPTLYHVTIPSNTSKTITSITLPYLGSDLTQHCQVPNLHILGIATH